MNMPSPMPADARLHRRRLRFIGQASPSAHSAVSPDQISRRAATKRIRESNPFGIAATAQTTADLAKALNYRQAYLQISRNSKCYKADGDGLASSCDSGATMAAGRAQAKK
jgi:hypothetical protein